MTPEVTDGRWTRRCCGTLDPAVIGILVRRGADFATAEDAVQEACSRRCATWPDDPPRDPKGWLVTVAWRKFLDAHAGRQRRAGGARSASTPSPRPGPRRGRDDTLRLYFLCAHPSLTPASAVALTLRAVGGLTTRQIAEAYLVPEATMAQRISRAKRTVADVRFDEPGDLRDGAARALPGVQRGLLRRRRPGRRGDPADPPARHDDRRARGRRPARADAAAPRPPPRPHRAPTAAWSRWPSRTAAAGTPTLIAEGVAILQAALARDRLGEYQAQAAIAALHADAPRPRRPTGCRSSSGTTSWSGSRTAPSSRLNRAVAVGEADGPRPGFAALGGARPGAPALRRGRPRTCTSAAGDLADRGAGCTPRRPAPRRTSPSATTSPGRRHGSTSRCGHRAGFACEPRDLVGQQGRLVQRQERQGVVHLHESSVREGLLEPPTQGELEEPVPARPAR